MGVQQVIGQEEMAGDKGHRPCMQAAVGSQRQARVRGGVQGVDVGVRDGREGREKTVVVSSGYKGQGVGRGCTCSKFLSHMFSFTLSV